MSTENRLGTLPEEVLIRRARQMLARKFLQDEIIPRIAKDETLNYVLIESLFQTFKEEHQERKGSDFESAHIWFAARRLRELMGVKKGIESDEYKLAEKTFEIIDEFEKTRVEKELGLQE